MVIKECNGRLRSALGCTAQVSTVPCKHKAIYLKFLHSRKEDGTLGQCLYRSVGAV